jgi:hypothetical protein
MKRIKRQSPGTVLGIIAVVIALTGTAFAATNLKLGQFDSSSRDRLAGTGVIQYATASLTTPTTTASFNTVHTFAVRCELSKKATSGGFKWTGATPPVPADYEILDAYPNGSGFVVRVYIEDGGTAENQQLSVFSNCVKSRAQRGTPPS